MRYLIAMLVLIPSAANAALYELERVKRADQDIYTGKTGSQTVVILTKYCYHYTYGEDAVLKWDKFDKLDNKIIFDDGTVCEVDEISVK